MPRKVIFSAMLVTLVTALSLGSDVLAADQPLNAGTLHTYANELNAAFPGQVDLYLVGKDFDFRQPSITDAHMVGCAQVAGVLYYVISMSNKSELFIPQAQVLAIHNRK